MKNITYKELLAIAFVIVVFYYVFFKKNSNEEKLKLIEDEKVISGFSEKDFKKLLQKKYRTSKEYLKEKGLTSVDLLNYADEIYNAKGLLNDNEEVIYAVFSRIPSIAVYSMLSLAFKIKYKKDLQAYLTSFLNDKELNNVYSIIKRKPKV